MNKQILNLRPVYTNKQIINFLTLINNYLKNSDYFSVYVDSQKVLDIYSKNF